VPEPQHQAALEERVLALLADGTPRGTGELAAALRVTRLGVSRVMTRLVAAGRVVNRRAPAAAPVSGAGWQARKATRQAIWTLREHA